MLYCTTSNVDLYQQHGQRKDHAEISSFFYVQIRDLYLHNLAFWASDDATCYLAEGASKFCFVFCVFMVRVAWDVFAASSR